MPKKSKINGASKVVEKRGPLKLLAEMQTSAVIVRKSVAAPQNIKGYN